MPKPSRKQFLARSLGAAQAAGLGTMYAGVVRAAGTYTLRCSSVAAATTSWNVWALQLAADVSRKSNGALKIEIYPNAQLAKEADSMTALQSGLIDSVQLQNTVQYESLFPQLAVFTMPFIFRSAAAGYKVVDGQIGDELFDQFAAKGVVGLCWVDSGFKQLETTTKAIREPEDMKGLRFRIQGGPVNVAMVQALGAIPVTIDFAEVYTALSQHTIDAIDPNLDGFVAGKLDTVCSHVAMTNHVFSLLPFVGAKKKLDSLPAELVKLLKDEAKATRGVGRSLSQQKVVDAIAYLKGKGIAFTEINYPAFRKAMDPVYTMMTPKLGDLVQRVSKAAGNA